MPKKSTSAFDAAYARAPGGISCPKCGDSLELSSTPRDVKRETLEEFINRSVSEKPSLRLLVETFFTVHQGHGIESVRLVEPEGGIVQPGSLAFASGGKPS